MNLKKILKTIKLNESSISFALGLIVVAIMGSLVFKYLKNTPKNIPNELLTGTTTEIAEPINSYEVKKGDSLWTIAEKYYGNGYKWVQIATENKLPNASQIEIGQKLTIPDYKEKLAGNGDNELNNEEATYIVQRGDSLWNIAVKKYGDGYKWVQIAKTNNLVNPNIIHAGNVLVLP